MRQYSTACTRTAEMLINVIVILILACVHVLYMWPDVGVSIMAMANGDNSSGSIIL